MSRTNLYSPSPKRTRLVEPQPSCSTVPVFPTLKSNSVLNIIPASAQCSRAITTMPLDVSTQPDPKNIILALPQSIPAITVVPMDVTIQPICSKTAPTAKKNVDPYSKPPFDTTIKLVTNPTVAQISLPLTPASSCKDIFGNVAQTFTKNARNLHSLHTNNSKTELSSNPAAARSQRHQNFGHTPLVTTPASSQRDIFGNMAPIPVKKYKNPYYRNYYSFSTTPAPNLSPKRKHWHQQDRHTPLPNKLVSSQKDNFGSIAPMGKIKDNNPFAEYLNSTAKLILKSTMAPSLKRNHHRYTSQQPKPTSLNKNISRNSASIPFKKVTNPYSQPPYDTTIKLVTKPTVTSYQTQTQLRVSPKPAPSNQDLIGKTASKHVEKAIDPYSQPPYDTSVNRVKYPNSACCHHEHKPLPFKIVRRSLTDRTVYPDPYADRVTCPYFHRLLNRIPLPKGALRIYRTIFTPIDTIDCEPETFSPEPVSQTAANYFHTFHDHTYIPPPRKRLPTSALDLKSTPTTAPISTPPRRGQLHAMESTSTRTRARTPKIALTPAPEQAILPPDRLSSDKPMEISFNNSIVMAPDDVITISPDAVIDIYNIIEISSSDSNEIPSCNKIEISCDDEIFSKNFIQIPSENEIKISSGDEVPSENLTQIPSENVIKISSENEVPSENLIQIPSENVIKISSENEVPSENLIRISSENVNKISSDTEVPSENLIQIPSENVIEISSDDEGTVKFHIKLFGIYSFQ